MAILIGFFIPSESNDVLSSQLRIYFTCGLFLEIYGGFKIANLARAGQLTLEVFRSMNV